MTADRSPKSEAPDTSPQARDLLARLYREIGISAVAAALQIPERRANREAEARREVPPMLREDLAA